MSVRAASPISSSLGGGNISYIAFRRERWRKDEGEWVGRERIEMHGKREGGDKYMQKLKRDRARDRERERDENEMDRKTEREEENRERK